MIEGQIKHMFEQLGVAPFLGDKDVTEIVINEENLLFVERKSIWEKHTVKNKSNALIKALGNLLINKSKNKREFDESEPMLSITMPAGERCQLILPPATEQASMTVRIPSKKKFSMDDYENQGVFAGIRPPSRDISPEDFELKNILLDGDYQKFLRMAITYRKNILVSGATGSGKTTFLKTLIELISHDERIITIEDAREIFISHLNKVHLMYPKDKSKSKVSAKSCLEATLRMKPDRIILAEVRGDEAFYFIRACGNGHDGSITSCHANSALMAYEQLALMIAASPEGGYLDYGVIKRLIHMTIDISIHFVNIKGKRYISGIDFEPERKLNLLKAA